MILFALGELGRGTAANEYLQHALLWRNKKKYSIFEKKRLI